MATQFKILVELACSPPEDGATLEAAAAHSLRMEAETQTLVITHYFSPTIGRRQGYADGEET